MGSSRMAWNSWPVIMHPKLDGERSRRLELPNHNNILISSTEDIIFFMEHIQDEFLRLSKVANLEYDGELYRHGWTFEQIHSVVSRTVNRHPDSHLMQFHIFDYCDESTHQIKRTINLAKIAQEFKSDIIKFVPYYLAYSFEEVMRYYELFLSQGYEGMIIRHIEAPYVRKRSTFMMKFKPKKKDRYRIIGWREEVSNEGIPKGRIGTLICCSDDGQSFGVSAGLNDELRDELWRIRNTNLINRECIVHYQALTSAKKVPKFCSKIEIL